MRRRSRAGGESTKAQRRKTAARKSRIAPKAARPRSSSAAREETKVARLTRELNEALQQQTATAEVLNIISRSTFDLRRCSTLWSSRRHVCARPTRVVIFRPSEGRSLPLGSELPSHDPEYLNMSANADLLQGRGRCVGRVLLERKSVQIPDVLAIQNTLPEQ